MRLTKFLAATAALMLSGTPLWAASLADGLGGPEGYGELSQGRNDDGSSNRINLPFNVNFFGENYTSFFVNNNGNITFNAALGNYTPQPFPISSQPMIAPFWGDVDTSCTTCGAVYVAAPNPTTTVVTWHDVGYFPSNPTKTNDFQLILTDRGAVAQDGDFDIEFRYNRLQWTTGGASGGVDGLGGIPAQAGYDAGDQQNFFTLPGSRTAAVLDLDDTSNVSLETPGLWRFAIRNGEITDGGSAATPLLPTVVTEEGFQFEFGVVINQRVFIDPVIAVGYDFIVDSGPLITSALFPILATDTDGYEVFGLDTTTGLYTISLGTVLGGEVFNFASAVGSFGVRGIDGSLDPGDPTAFVTGLTFNGTGDVSMRQRPFTVDTGTGAIPEPATWALMLAGFGLVGHAMRRRGGALVAA